MCLCKYVCAHAGTHTYVPWCTYGGQRTTLWSQSPSIFTKLGMPGLLSKRFHPLSHIASPFFHSSLNGRSRGSGIDSKGDFSMAISEIDGEWWGRMDWTAAFPSYTDSKPAREGLAANTCPQPMAQYHEDRRQIKCSLGLRSGVWGLPSSIHVTTYSILRMENGSVLEEGPVNCEFGCWFLCPEV